jgi:imidazolonepropionase-like amidohydrolase
MTMPEVLAAATINAAASVGRSHSHGSLEVGKVADMVVVKASRYIPFHLEQSQDISNTLFFLLNEKIDPRIISYLFIHSF